MHNVHEKLIGSQVTKGWQTLAKRSELRNAVTKTWWQMDSSFILLSLSPALPSHNMPLCCLHVPQFPLHYATLPAGCASGAGITLAWWFSRCPKSVCLWLISGQQWPLPCHFVAVEVRSPGRYWFLEDREKRGEKSIYGRTVGKKWGLSEGWLSQQRTENQRETGAGNKERGFWKSSLDLLGWMDASIHERVARWVEGWKDGWADGQMGGRKEVRTKNVFLAPIPAWRRRYGADGFWKHVYKPAFTSPRPLHQALHTTCLLWPSGEQWYRPGWQWQWWVTGGNSCVWVQPRWHTLTSVTSCILRLKCERQVLAANAPVHAT